MKLHWHPRESKLAALTLAALAVAAAPRAQAIIYIGSAAIHAGIDASGDSTILPNGIAQNALEGFGSGIAYTGAGNRFALIPDRGPNANSYPGGTAVDNTVAWDTRYQVFDLTPQYVSGNSYNIVPNFAGTTLLKTEAGAGQKNLVGLSSAGNPAAGGALSSTPSLNLRYDPESVRVGSNGHVYISDEYGPNVYEFDQQGNRVGVFQVPTPFFVPNPSPQGALEEHPNNTIGRVDNKGMEGLALTPDGKKLIGIMQSPLLQDNSLTAGNSKNGTLNRIVVFDNDPTSPTFRQAIAQYAYQLASKSPTVSEIVALNDHQFLVDERDGNNGGTLTYNSSGVPTNSLTKKFYLIDTSTATDISNAVSLPATATAGGAFTYTTASGTAAGQAVGKQLFMDLFNGTGVDPASFTDFEALLTHTNLFDGFPEKLEGMAFGPDITTGPLAGDHLLLITNDNDFLSQQPGGNPNFIFAFAVSNAELATLGASFSGEVFSPNASFAPAAVPTPEPVSMALVSLAGAALLLCGTRRSR